MKKILLVDDQINFIKMISIKLSKLGYSILTAENGEIALNIANEKKPDLIIMDIMMPVMDGFTAAAELKENPKTASIPLIFLSAKGSINDQEKAKELGASDFIAKPFSPKVLVEKIQNTIGE